MKSLLLLEEDVEGREILSKMLRRRGFHVIPAEDEADALAILGSGCPVELVLAGAAYHDRLDFLAALRERRRSVPVVFLADYRDNELSWRGLLSGFYVSRKHNLYVNARPIKFYELDRLLRIVPSPRERRHRGSLHGMNFGVA